MHLAVLYPFPSSFPISIVLASALLLLLVTIFSIAAIAHAQYLAVGWFWFLGNAASP